MSSNDFEISDLSSAGVFQLSVHRFGKTIGQFKGKPIASYLLTDDRALFVFRGICPDTSLTDIMGDDEIIVSPGLVYRRRPVDELALAS